MRAPLKDWRTFSAAVMKQETIQALFSVCVWYLQIQSFYIDLHSTAQCLHVFSPLIPTYFLCLCHEVQV